MSKETRISAKYSDYSNVFSSDSAAELPEYTRINNPLIDLLDNKQLLYSLIYSLELVGLEMLTNYIEANIASSFIKLSQFLATVIIPFVQKKHSSLRLYIDYPGLNKMIVENCYSLPLIGESFDRLGYAKYFTQLELTNA